MNMVPAECARTGFALKASVDMGLDGEQPPRPELGAAGNITNWGPYLQVASWFMHHASFGSLKTVSG